MNSDLILSILSLDAYSRGYGQILILNAGDSSNGQNEIGRAVGNFLISAQNITTLAIENGFYAVAYKNQVTGETVISFRGTDNLLFDSNAFLLGGGDIYNPDLTHVSDTVRLAIE